MSIKFSLLEQLSDNRKRFSETFDNLDKIGFLERCLNRILLLQGTFKQDKKHNAQIDVCSGIEQELFNKPVASAGKGEKVFVQNSLTQKYLVCQQEEISDETGTRLKHQPNTVFQLANSCQNDRAIWLLANDGSDRGLMIKNVVSKRYLVHSLDQRDESLPVVGNPLTHIRQSPSSSFHSNFLMTRQKYGGLWRTIKIHDLIVKKNDKRPRTFEEYD